MAVTELVRVVGLVGGLIFIMFASGFIQAVESDVEKAAALENEAAVTLEHGRG